MKLWFALIPIAFGSMTATASPCHSAMRDARHFTVDIIAINGEEFVVKDASGTHGSIHVSDDTEKYGHFQPGDRIEAWVYPNGHAKTVVIMRSAAVIQEDQWQPQPQQEAHQRRAQR